MNKDKHGNETLHTPKPWLMRVNATGVVYVTDVDGKQICSISAREDGIDNKAKKIERSANGRVIAEAPNLLFQIKKALVKLKFSAESTRKHIRLIHDLERARDDAQIKPVVIA